MKKIVLSAVCLVAVAAAGFGGYTYYENQTMDPWLKANIAALATIETPDKGEGGDNDAKCANYGYKHWYLEPVDPYTTYSEFKDCWCNDRRGYGAQSCK